MPVVWKEFPEINRKVAFTFNFESPNYPLGCHCGSISGVTASFGSGHYASNDGKNIEALDSDKSIKYKKDTYTGMWVAPIEETDTIVKYIEKIKLKFEDISPSAYSEIVTKCERLPLWVLSDVINPKAPARKRAAPTYGGYTYEVYGSTRDFAKYLIDKEVGYIMESPIIQNPHHRSKTHYSLNQGWFWVPPNHLIRTIGATKVHGQNKLPSKEQWAHTVAQDLGLASRDPDTVLKQVLEDGVFPKGDYFPRRGRDGRFVAKEA